MRKYIPLYSIVGMAFFSIVQRFTATIIALLYEKAGEVGEYTSYSYIYHFDGYVTFGLIAYLAYIFLSAIRMKKTVQSAFALARDEKEARKIPWRRIFFAFWGSGELLNFLICCIPVGLTTFGLYTSSIVYFLYVRLYAFPMGRVDDFFLRTPHYIKQDFFVFIPFYLIYALITLAILFGIFMLCVHQEKKIGASTISCYEVFFHIVQMVVVRMLAFVPVYFISIRDGTNAFKGICAVIYLLIFAIWDIRDCQKQFTLYRMQTGKISIQSILCRILPGEIFMLLASFALLFYYETFRFGKLLLYPIYALFHAIYLNHDDRLATFTAREHMWPDYAVFILCWIFCVGLYYFAVFPIVKRKTQKGKVHRI